MRIFSFGAISISSVLTVGSGGGNVICFMRRVPKPRNCSLTVSIGPRSNRRVPISSSNCYILAMRLFVSIVGNLTSNHGCANPSFDISTNTLISSFKQSFQFLEIVP